MAKRETLGITCAECGEQTQKPLAWFKDHDSLVCACGVVITLAQHEQILVARQKLREGFSASLRKSPALRKLLKR